MVPKPAVDILLYPPPELQADIPFPVDHNIKRTSKAKVDRGGIQKDDKDYQNG